MAKRDRHRRRNAQHHKRRGEEGFGRFTPRGGARTGGEPSGNRPLSDDPESAKFLLRNALFAAADSYAARDGDSLEDFVAVLSDAPSRLGGTEMVGRELATVLDEALRAAWERGWQPADVARVAGRVDERHRGFAVDVIAADAARFSDAAMDPRWVDQLHRLGARIWWEPAMGPHLGQWAAREKLSQRDALRCGIALLSTLLRLPPLPMLCDPPGASTGRRLRSQPSATAGSAGSDPRMLEKVRALLAKAESTTFAEEAESLTAKAQEMMSKYAIDRAMLDSIAAGAAGGVGADACGVRLGVDDPYAGAKAILLSEVAEANSCRAVWSKELGFSTVFGMETDLGSVELLYTSLLVQASSAMVAAGPQVDFRGRSRTRSFRQSFLVGYAGRIGERLREADRAGRQAAATEYGEALLPVLASRAKVVEDAFRATFPKIKSARSSVTNGAGLRAGRIAAEQARLNARPEIP